MRSSVRQLGTAVCHHGISCSSPGVRGLVLVDPHSMLRFSSTFPTCIDIMVPVQGGELFAVVPGKGVACVAMIAPQPQLIVLALWLQSEASIFCKDLSARPVLHGYKQFVVALVRQPVDILQAQPVFAVDVPKPLLGKTQESMSEVAVPQD